MWLSVSLNLNPPFLYPVFPSASFSSTSVPCNKNPSSCANFSVGLKSPGNNAVRRSRSLEPWQRPEMATSDMARDRNGDAADGSLTESNLTVDGLDGRWMSFDPFIFCCKFVCKLLVFFFFVVMVSIVSKTTNSFKQIQTINSQKPQDELLWRITSASAGRNAVPYRPYRFWWTMTSCPPNCRAWD